MVLGVSNRGDPLEPYRRKRDPERTSEPFGGEPAPVESADTRRFVVQLHRARRLHYDFRFEHEGVLRSWAVPRGFALDPVEKRLAVAVEDHPLEYAGFEGLIAPGNYGAGAVIVWDQGLLRAKGDPAQGLERGRFEFELQGYKLRGTFVLVRTRGADGSWLLIKKHDAYVRTEDPGVTAPRSILSGRTVEEVAAGRSRLDGVVEELAARGVARRTIPARERKPMLAARAPEPFDRPGWVFEIKYDGVRVLVERSGELIRLRSRGGHDLTSRFPELLSHLRALTAEGYVIDGELVARDSGGRLSLAGLQPRLQAWNARDIAQAAAAAPADLVAFDCLALEGFDCRGLPLLDRKALLQRLVPPAGPVSYCEHLIGDGVAIFAAAAAQQLEGIVAKRAAGVYVGRRSEDWLKVKCHREEDFVIGGFTAPRGARAGLGALLVGQYDGERLRYAGRVGAGLSEAMLAQLAETLRSRELAECPFAEVPARVRARWVQPELVCGVRFSERTGGGQLRHPRFIGLRAGADPSLCTSPSGAADGMPRGEVLVAQEEGGDTGPPDVVAVPLSNLDKVFWPDAGYTKGDLVAYYQRIAPYVLPFLRDRPLTLTRYPDGIEGKYFYQQDAPEWVPPWVRRVRLYSKDGAREVDHFVCDDVQSLIYLANLGCIPLHVWSARLGSLDRPDWLVLDLDPGDAPFSDVIAVARDLRQLLTAIGLQAYPKTSGASGLHLLLPLGARYGHADAKRFAELVARIGAERRPDIATVERRPSRREGKVYIDWGQNGHGRTIAAPYAVRARPGAPVSAPLRWPQVRRGLSPAQFTIGTVPGVLRHRGGAGGGDPLLAILGPGVDLGRAIERLDRVLDELRS